MNQHLMKKYAFLVLGTLSLGIGMIGVVIPILPTTPFLLIASFLYLRSSKRMHNWLINHKVFGSYIYCYMTYRAISARSKTGILIFLWATLAGSVTVIQQIYIEVLLVIVGLAVTTHILLLKTFSAEEMKEMNQLDIRKIDSFINRERRKSIEKI